MPKLPIDPCWIEDELLPFLRYAFSHRLPYDADLMPPVQQAIAFCMVKPDYATDGDDLLFERTFMAILHRHKCLAPDLTLVTLNLEPLAKFLIRRAQLKGSFELLGRSNVASAEWVAHEKMRLVQLVNRDQWDDEGPTRAVFKNITQPKAVPAEAMIDPRLSNAQPGQYVTPGLSATITPAEDEYYRQQNRTIEAVRTQTNATPSWNQQLHTAASQSKSLTSGQGSLYGHDTNHFPTNQQHQVPAYVQSLGQHAAYQTQNGYHNALRDGNTQHHPSQAVSSQTSQQALSSLTKATPPMHTSHSDPAQANNIAYQPLAPQQQSVQSIPLQSTSTINSSYQSYFHASPPYTTTSTNTWKHIPHHNPPVSPRTIPTSSDACPPNPQYFHTSSKHPQTSAIEIAQQHLIAKNILRLHQTNTFSGNATTAIPIPHGLPNNYYVPQHTVSPQPVSWPLNSMAWDRVEGETSGESSVLAEQVKRGLDVHPEFSNIVSSFPVVGFGGEKKDGGGEVRTDGDDVKTEDA